MKVKKVIDHNMETVSKQAIIKPNFIIGKRKCDLFPILYYLQKDND